MPNYTCNTNLASLPFCLDCNGPGMLESKKDVFRFPVDVKINSALYGKDIVCTTANLFDNNTI